MTNVDLKLKQASAVLGVTAKDLQNLVQLKVINPPRKNSYYRFDRNILLEAKVAFYLKESLGTSSVLLARFTGAVFQDLGSSDSPSFRDVWIQSLPYRGSQPVEVKIPIRALARELDQCIPQVAGLPDLPRGRKRPEWKSEFLDTLARAGADLKGISSKKLSKEIAEYRKLRRKEPEITVVGASRKKTA